ncbi:MAG: GNAT family N-acetyltransferase [Candidatus Krumholzibacteriota bacterium]
MADRARHLQGLLRPFRGRAGARNATADARAAGEILTCAEEMIAAAAPAEQDRDLWCEYLAVTRHPDFLTALPDSAARNRWAETTFALCDGINYTLGDLLDRRAADQPEHVLFQELAEPGSGSWNYHQVRRRARSIAAMFLTEGPRPELAGGGSRDQDGPRVAIFCQNSLGSACCDLACLTNDILVTPLNIHFSSDDLVWIFDRLCLTVAVCDHPDRLETLVAVRARTQQPFVIFTLNHCPRVGEQGIRLLEEQRALLDSEEIDQTLAARPRRTMREPATVMFTSGSTGRPKGVAFSQYNLVTKRFARAAALPEVGRNEVMLCYLPLFHTFGRYLEMLGTIFWGGTYIFAGNPSAATLLAQFLQVRPTALISVPVRWVQIRDRVMELAQGEEIERPQEDIFRDVVGDRLSWGLSAAGYLDPRVFRFFHRNNVNLCSGFGMTEGTGGLTMTPPGDYVENSVGVPLPGVKVRFSDLGELQIAGCYIARYLPEDAPAGCLAVADQDSDDFWLATGDLFRRTRDDHLEIVDRIKDIYKNNRGQTIAPRVVESVFEQVPGIKRTFLAGDGRSYNTLLIVPDDQDEVLQSLANPDDRREYFQQIITTANPVLGSHERVVNFAVLDRDFSQDRDELTAKGSFRRKVIEANFAEEIAGLYRSSVRVLKVGPYSVRIPRWYFRDLGVLEDAITARNGTLVNNESGRSLVLAAGSDGRARIGDLEYRVEGQVIDLGLLARQPLLWMGNPQLMNFSPCRTGWDTELGAFSEQVYLPTGGRSKQQDPVEPGRVDRQLVEVNDLCNRALFRDGEQALDAIHELDRELGRAGARQGRVIRRRLESLANHPTKAVRCRAYQVLVLDQPTPDYLRYLPAFIESGKPFLDEESFTAISKARIEPRRLQAFRQRLHTYRTQLSWPADERTRRLFVDLFRLLADFGRFHPEFYGPIREELVSWAMHDEDPALAASTLQEFNKLAAWFEEKLKTGYEGLDPQAWRGKIVFQEGLGLEEVRRLEEVLIGTTFLRHSLMLAFEGEKLDLAEIGPGGIWVSRIISRFKDSRYRVSINTNGGKHFDLQVIIRQDFDQKHIRNTIFWYIVLGGYPFGTAMLPNFGCFRPELGALSMAYVSDLTVWEKIREFSGIRGPGTAPPTRMRWHQLMVRAMSVVVRGWRNSGRRIIPGLITPNNIVVPEPDFRRGAVQNNLSGWKPYSGPVSLIRPIWRNMYQHTISHYPWSQEYLEREWIFEAFVEALGAADALVWLKELQEEITGLEVDEMGLGFVEALAGFIRSLEDSYHPPLNLLGAIKRFEDWETVNTQANLKARLEIIEELTRLYRLDRFPEIARFTLFRNTYFKDADLALQDIFDRLLVRMFRHPNRRATQMVELSDLQSSLTDTDDRAAFNRLAFPHRMRSDSVEVRAVGDPARSQVVVRSTIQDQHEHTYGICEPAGPAEVGQLYRLFLKAGFPKTISEADLYLVATDEAEQIIGGVVYRMLDDEAVFLDGIVVNQALAERGIARAILADFCTRLTALGVKTIKTHFFLRRFYQKHGFRVDERWGGLVRFL